jgi:inner membrane protein
MDLVTQGLAGAVLAQSVARPAQVRLAAAIGTVAGLLPDADVVLGAPDDPLRNLELHRHFTHALVLAPAGALLVAALAWPLTRGKLRFVQVYAFALLGVASAGLVDACTSFGTHLLWPFSEERVAWNLVAIIDPLFTLPLLAGVVLALRRRSAAPARAGLALALAYLLAAVVQRERAEAAARELARERGHDPVRLEVKPTMANVVLWRSVYLADDRFHVAAIRVGWSGARAYPGGSVPRFDARELPDDVARDSVLAEDIARFGRITDGYLARHPHRPEVLGDARYAMLPNSTIPLWGIVVDPARPDRHVEFLALREMNAAVRRDFLAMLRGRPLEGDRPAPE